MKIANTDELISYCAHVFSGNQAAGEVIIADSFVGEMRFRGQKWQGRVDTNIAMLVIDSQKLIRRTYVKSSRIDRFPLDGAEKEIKIEFEVNHGSSTIISILEKLLSVPLLNVSSEHALYAMLIISCTMLGMKYFDTKAELLKKIEDEETKRKLIEMHQAVVADIKQSLKPAVRFARKMDSDDTLEFCKSGKLLTRTEAIQHFLIQHTPEALEFYIDDKYDVTNVHLKTTKVTLEIRGIRFTASINNISEQDKVTLFTDIEEAGVASAWPSLDLQITLRINGSDHFAQIIALGGKRPDSVTLEHALFVSGIADDTKPQRKLPLLEFAGE